MWRFINSIYKFLTWKGWNKVTEFMNAVMVDSEKDNLPNRKLFGSADFEIDVVFLSAAVIQLDGIKRKSELAVVRRFFTDNFGKSTTNALLKRLRLVLSRKVNTAKYYARIKQHMQNASKLHLLDYLLRIASAKGKISAKELSLIETIAHGIGFNSRGLESVKVRFSFMFASSQKNQKNAFLSSIDMAYKTLEIDKKATDAKVKKAYRSLVKKYHPDTFRGKSEFVLKENTAKFREIQSAYEKICKARNIK